MLKTDSQIAIAQDQLEEAIRTACLAFKMVNDRTWKKRKRKNLDPAVIMSKPERSTHQCLLFSSERSRDEWHEKYVRERIAAHGTAMPSHNPVPVYARRINANEVFVRGFGTFPIAG
jgi:hypothetical protein